MYFDTHAHLNSKILLQNIDEVIKRALAAKVDLLNVIGYDLESSLKAVELAAKYPFIYASVGIHPTELLTMKQDDFNKIEAMLNNPKVIAVGEIGLDYYHDDSYNELQKEYFVKFIKLAKKYDKPLVIHVRDALKDAYDILAQYQDELVGGVMHCYSGSAQMANDFIRLGLYIGLDGPVTFKNARVPKEVAALVPIEKLVIETDCPYLTPHPFRGKVNEPSYLPLIAKEIAVIRDMDEIEVANILYHNSKRLFKL